MAEKLGDYNQTTGKNAQSQNINAAKEMARIVKTTLGPKGMDKMLVDQQGHITITNDGFTILDEMDIAHPAAKMIREISKTQESEIGDGPQPIYSNVLTPNGFVKMGSLKVGDEICGTNGTIQRVIGVFPKGEKQIYKIKFSDGRETECCEEHLWKISNKEGVKKILTTKSMFKNKSYRLDKKGDKIYNYYVPISKPEFCKKDLVLDPYLVGVLIGDGSLSDNKSVRISLGIAKEHIIDKLYLPEGLKLSVRYVDNKNCFEINIIGKTKNGKSIIDFLKKIGLHGTKSGTKFIPKQYLYSDHKSRTELLQGLSDTDGHINKRGLLEYSTISKKLYFDVLELLRGVGKTTHSYLRERLINEGSYSDKPIYRISELKGYKYGNKISEIIKTDKYTEMQCIKVSNSDHLYFTDDYILTHNTTSAVMIAGKLLENAETLINKNIHPTVICKGYLLASDIAKKVVDEFSISDISDTILKQIAMTSMTGKASEGSRELLAELIVKAVNIVKEKDEVRPEGEDPCFKIELGKIKLQKVTGNTIDKSELVEGIVLEQPIAHEGMPRNIQNPKIALLDIGLENKNPEIEVMSQVSTPQELEAFRSHDTDNIQVMVNKIVESGANVVLTQKGFDELALHEFSKKGIIAIRRINKYDMDHLAKSTGARVVSSVNELTKEDLGNAGEVREVRNKDSSLFYVRKCADPKAVTILVHASTEHIVSEIYRAMTDGIGDVISTLNEKKFVPGGGAIEMVISKRLKEFAITLSGREQLAVEQFAEALEFIPETLAENAGMDSINVITELKQKLENGVVGLNLFTEKIEDTQKAGIIEPSKIKTQAINSAVEVAVLLLRCDDLLLAKSNVPV